MRVTSIHCLCNVLIRSVESGPITGADGGNILPEISFRIIPNKTKCSQGFEKNLYELERNVMNVEVLKF